MTFRGLGTSVPKHQKVPWIFFEVCQKDSHPLFNKNAKVFLFSEKISVFGFIKFMNSQAVITQQLENPCGNFKYALKFLLG